MGDHFALLADRLLTESTLEATMQGRNHMPDASPSASQDIITRLSSHRMEINVGTLPNKLVECRICHDEDEDLNMEMPCSCRGSLKYAHRICVQKWCNEKGDNICEICRQQFKPGYTAPPLFHYGDFPVNFRRNWEISTSDLHNAQYVTTVAPDGNFIDPNFDEYTVPAAASLMCCRIIGIIFMVLLVLRHTLPFITYESGEYSISLFMLLVLRITGILLLVYVMVKALTAIHRGHSQQDSQLVLPSALDEENESTEQHHLHVVQLP